MQKIRHSRARLSSVVCLAFVLAACSSGDTQLSKTDIQLAAGDLRTYAASTQMLLEQCTAQRATETFCKQQAQLLTSKVEDALNELHGQGGPAEYQRRQLDDIAVRLKDIVVRAEQSSSAVSDAADAGRLAAAAKILEDELRK